jgi:hypothetical protein
MVGYHLMMQLISVTPVQVEVKYRSAFLVIMFTLLGQILVLRILTSNTEGALTMVLHLRQLLI